ncbi:hypothetical protein N9157_02650 [Saprospiraceae bacterium]|jgi:hypothetical protein|nr:hypothetical protein [Saprospiraceae bacterium]
MKIGSVYSIPSQEQLYGVVNRTKAAHNIVSGVTVHLSEEYRKLRKARKVLPVESVKNSQIKSYK